MSDYADAINREIEAHAEKMRTYGALLAQAKIPLSEVEFTGEDMKHVRQGYEEQLRAFPNG